MRFIVYDGDCGFCNKTVMFIAKNDKNNNFKFVSSLSEFGVKILLKNKIKGLEKSTIILIEGEKTYIKSNAVMRTLLKIPNYKILGIFLYLMPKKICDFFYEFISNHRKQLSINTDCEIPTPDIRKKFIQ